METPSKKHGDPVPTVDIIVSKKNKSQILIETRGRDPFRDRFCIPGGHVEYGETVEAAALRELREECSIKAKLTGILGVYSDPKRDPRGQRISTVFVGRYESGELEATDDAKSAEWRNLDWLISRQNKKRFAFDHLKILTDYQSWLKKRTGDFSFWSSKNK